MTTETEPLARGTLAALADDHLVLAVPESDYRLRLKLGVPKSKVKTPVGKRIKGRIEADALRIHPASGGGRFIEPIDGEPRIVAGTVLQVDVEGRRVLVNVAVPVWMSWPEGQDPAVLAPGRLVNCYVRSGTVFTPA